MPIAVVIILGTDIVARTFMGDAALAGFAVFWQSALVVTGTLITLPLIYVGFRREGMIIPVRGSA